MHFARLMFSTFAIAFALGCATAPDEAVGSSHSADTAPVAMKDGLLGVDAAINLKDFAPNAPPSTRPAALADLGVRRVRIEMLPGADAELDHAITELAKVQIKVNLQIDYVTVPNFKDAIASRTWPDYAKRFTAEASRLATKFGARVNTIQIWNEQDFDWVAAGSRCMPTGNYQPCLEPDTYGQLLADSCAAISTANAGVKVITGGFASPRANRWPYVAAVFATPGVKSCVRGIGYHVYGNVTKTASSEFVCDPASTTCNEIDLVHDVQGLHEKSGTTLPITIDEWGVFTDPLDNGAHAAERSAILARNVRGFFAALSTPALKDAVVEATYYAYDDGGENKLSMSTRPTVEAAFRHASCPAKETTGCTK